MLNRFLEDIQAVGIALAGSLRRDNSNSHPRTPQKQVFTSLFNVIWCSENGFFRREVFCRFLEDTYVIRMKLARSLRATLTHTRAPDALNERITPYQVVKKRTLLIRRKYY